MRTRAFASPRVKQLLIPEALSVVRAVRAQFLAPRAGGPSQDRRLARLAGTLLQLRVYTLPALQQGALSARPHEAMVAVESVLQQALDREVVVLAAGIDEPNYMELDLWSEVSTQLPDLDLPDKISEAGVLFMYLNFPSAEKNNVLLHANLSHEAGHQLVRHFKWADPILAVLTGDVAVQSLSAFIEPQSRYTALNETERTTVLQNLLARTGQGYSDSGVLANWVAELLCDAVALAILGPAAAIAFTELLGLGLGQEQDCFESSHPRWALRVKLHRLHLRGEDGASPTFDDLLISYPDVVTNLEHVHQDLMARPPELPEAQFESHEGFRIERTVEFYQAVERALENKLPEILRRVRDDLGPRGLLYTPSSFASEVPVLIEKLEALLPPSTIGSFPSEQPASYAGIMNAGAVARMDRLGEITASVGRYAALEAEQVGKGRYEAEELTFRLVRKALADADLHRRWLEARAS